MQDFATIHCPRWSPESSSWHPAVARSSLSWTLPPPPSAPPTLRAQGAPAPAGEDSTVPGQRAEVGDGHRSPIDRHFLWEEDGEFHSHGQWGYPNSWMVYFMENPTKIRGFEGTPMDWKTPCMKIWGSNSLEAGLVSHFIQNHELSKWFWEISSFGDIFCGWTNHFAPVGNYEGNFETPWNTMGSTIWCRLSSIHSINLILGLLPGQMWGWLGRLKQEVKQPVPVKQCGGFLKWG